MENKHLRSVDGPDWTAPPPEECDDYEHSYEPAEGVRAFTRRRVHRGRTIEFVVTLRALVLGRWVDVVRYDTCHGEVHVHRFGMTGREFARRPLWTIHTPADVEAGLDEAERSVNDEWQENLRRWRRGE